MTHSTVIKVLGLGGAGSNAVNRMIQLGIEGVQFIAANTDSQALATSEAATRLLLGPRTTRGLGAGGQPGVGEAAADESANTIADALEGADMVFIAAGMGGGTGTGAIPIAARMARQNGSVTIAVVTLPFSFEASRRMQNAQAGIAKLRGQCDTLIVVPNDKLLSILPRDVTFDVALRVADEVLRQGIQGMAELVTRPGLINVDFANVRALMQLPGGAFLSIGHGRGASKAVDAVEEALHHKLLEGDALAEACGVLIHFTGGDDLSLFEINQAMDHVAQSVQPEAQMVWGATVDPMLNGRVQVILVATGVGGGPASQLLPSEAARPGTPIAKIAAPLDGRPEPARAEAVLASLGEAGGETADWGAGEESTLAAPVPSIDNLDLPAFMRRRRHYAGK